MEIIGTDPPHHAILTTEICLISWIHAAWSWLIFPVAWLAFVAGCCWLAAFELKKPIQKRINGSYELRPPIACSLVGYGSIILLLMSAWDHLSRVMYWGWPLAVVAAATLLTARVRVVVDDNAIVVRSLSRRPKRICWIELCTLTNTNWGGIVLGTADGRNLTVPACLRGAAVFVHCVRWHIDGAKLRDVNEILERWERRTGKRGSKVNSVDTS